MFEDYEAFTPNQIKTLEQYVSNTDGNIFVLHNLPEVIKGALFSRYSRSALGLRSLLLKEFIASEELAFDAIANQTSNPKAQLEGIKKAQSFYDRILDGYGDDSIAELGGAHLAVEYVSMIACKVIEDCRIGGSPLEKSTRYIYFDQKIHNEYLFYREPTLMISAYRDLYVKTCNMLFDTYSELIPPLTELMEAKFPKEENISKAAYTAALRARVLDCLRGLLPASTLTNMGLYGNGRFFEGLIRKLHSHNLAEMQDIGKQAFNELYKVIPSFIKRADLTHKHYQGFQQFQEATQTSLKQLAQLCSQEPEEIDFKSKCAYVKLVSYNPDAVGKVAASLLYPYSNQSLMSLELYCAQLPEDELTRIFDAASSYRENRRHKSPRALEHAEFTFEIVADFGIYRDLQRHRTLTQDRQLLTCDYSYYLPPEILGTKMEHAYREALEQAKNAYDSIAAELPEEAQYVVPMAYNIRWYFHINLRSLQWLCELRSTPAGHPNYRFVAQEMARQVCQAFPVFERFLKFVCFDDNELGRLEQEQRNEDKKKQTTQE
ncbi:MAG: thyX [Chlamydiales bacterium]|jgi:thymidylate synthase ThyX|nr:thyX [Chlamydiales bacterium]